MTGAPFQLVVGTADLTVPHDMLLSLDEAVDLPRLGGRFKARDLRRYASPKRKRNRLPAIQPGREWLTTPEWIDQWIEKMKGGTSNASDTPSGAAGSPSISAAASAAAASLEARLAAPPAKPKSLRKGG